VAGVRPLLMVAGSRRAGETGVTVCRSRPGRSESSDEIIAENRRLRQRIRQLEAELQRLRGQPPVD
jgi:hypothetical protein